MNHIRKTEKLELADLILAMLNRKLKFVADLPENFSHEFYVENYCNGREQGLCIQSGGFSLSFSEHRNSDAIVVYYNDGNFNESFSPQGNVPGERAYNIRQLFHPEKIDDAVYFIFNCLIGYARKMEIKRKEMNLKT